MMELKRKGHQGITTIEAFEYENTRSDVKCCDYWEKWKAMFPGTQREFTDKVVPDIDGFTDEPVVQCDVQVVENTFVVDAK